MDTANPTHAVVIAEKAIHLYEHFRGMGHSPALARAKVALHLMRDAVKESIIADAPEAANAAPVCSACGMSCMDCSGRSCCCGAEAIQADIVAETMERR